MLFTMGEFAKQTLKNNQFKKDHPRLMCNIPFKVRAHAQEKVAVIINTWGAKCDVLRFFIDRGDKELFDEKYHKYLVELDMVRRSGDATGVDHRPTKHIWE
jgi:hypothetical protein